MNIDRKAEGGTLTVTVGGRIDTTTAAEFEKQMKDSVDGVSELVLDFSKLEYISSSGLRALLSIMKTMQAAGGSMCVTNCSSNVLEVFAVTGFSRLLTIK